MTNQNGLGLYEILRACHLFKRLNDDQVRELADSLPIEAIRAKTVIYEQGGASRAFYFILDGTVRTVLQEKQGEREVERLDAADYFGQDAIEPHGFYDLRAEALTDVTVAVLSHDAYIRLIRRYPMVEGSFKVIYRSYLLNNQQGEVWHTDNETVRYIARKHEIFLYLRLLVPIGVILASIPLWTGFFAGSFSLFLLTVSGLVTALGIGMLLWFWLDWSNDYVIITNRRVIYQERVVLMYESLQESPLEAILSDDIVTDFWGRWLGFGNVIVRTFTGTMTLPRLAVPREVKMILGELRTRAVSRGRVSRRGMMQNVIRKRLGGNQNAPIPQQNQPLPAAVKPGQLQTLLDRLFLTRWEKGDAIIYRTHWLKLVAKIAVPAGVGLFLFALILWAVIQRSIYIWPVFLVLLFLLLLVDTGFGIYRYADWSNDQYIITRMEVVDVYKKPLGREERSSAPLESIQTIHHERKNLIALIFNYGTVFIRVGDESLSFNDVPNPANVQREVFERFWERKQAKEKRAADEEQERMVEWIEAYHDVRREMQ